MALHDTMDNVSGRTAAWDCPREEGYMAELTALIGRQKEIKELMEREMARRCGTCTAADLAALLYEIEQCRVADRRIRYSHIRDFHEQTFHLFRSGSGSRALLDGRTRRSRQAGPQQLSPLCEVRNSCTE